MRGRALSTLSKSHSSCVLASNRKAKITLNTHLNPNFMSTLPISATASGTSTRLLNSPTVARSVGYWLLGMSGLVAGMVSIGGITRLTKSGLSMTDWKLQGTMPPTNADEWMKEFTRYKQYPEWQQRQSMTLDEFKYIFYWEWGHRMMGRSLGVAFAVPFLVFAVRGMIPRQLMPRMALLFSLGGTQGLVGWWMVKSGLDKKTIIGLDENREIRVSPYRLATHLGMAFTTFGACLWTALEILIPTKDTLRTVVSRLSTGVGTGTAGTVSKAVGPLISSDIMKSLQKVRKLSIFNLALVATTVISGAYVAGNDAGNAYNTFPKMGDEWMPSGMMTLEPSWRNLFENTATVQFDHRVLALTTLSTITTMFLMARKGSAGKDVHGKQLVSLWHHILPNTSKNFLYSTFGMVGAQVGLGISTLLLYVPIPLAAAHQLGSLILLTFSTGVVHSLRFIPLLPAAMTATATATGTATTAATATAAAASRVAVTEVMKKIVK